MKLTALIIDDEAAAREGLAADIRDIPYIDVVGSACNSFEAFELIHQFNPAVIFLDIDMPGMTGLEFIKLLKVKPLVILTTAYREYALESYDLGVLDYLLKPISPERLKIATEKALAWLKEKGNDVEQSEKHIFLKCNSRMERISLKNIFYFEGANNYVFIHTNSMRYISYITLKRIEELLPAGEFIKVHKSYIISRRHIQSIDRNSVRVNNMDIPLSKTFRKVVRKAILPAGS